MLRVGCNKVFSAGLRHVGKRGYSAAAAAMPAPTVNPDIEHKQVGQRSTWSMVKSMVK